MIKFPAQTQLPKPQKMDKKMLLKNLNLSAEMKRDLTDQIQKIQITHQIAPNTTNIMAGKNVQQIMVMHIVLKGMEINHSLMANLDEQMGMYLAFIIESSDGKQSFIIHFKEPTTAPGKHFTIRKRFESSNDEEIEFKGNDLDQVYENLVREVAPSEISHAKIGNLAENIQINEQIAKLTKQALALETKMRTDKSMRKQLAYKRERAEMLKQIETLKGGKI
ncbi:MAG: DUF4391 domain-containing protein [Turicibacter sp.]|nr:DUF4391 domain-containing protein [Turicibacter sp.]